MFPFCHTEPGAAWDTTDEGAQTFVEYQEHPDIYIADSEEYPFGQNTPGMDQPNVADDMQTRWTAVPTADMKTVKAVAMRRTTSKSSTASQKHRTLKASSRKSRARATPLAPAAAGDSHYAHFEGTGNATSLFPETCLGNGRIMDPQQYLAATQGMEGLSAQQFVSGMMDLSPDSLPYGGEMGFSIAQHVNPSATQIFDPRMPGGSPHSWESASSRISSPGLPDDTWSNGPIASSPTGTHGSSPDFQGHTSSIMSRNMSAAHVVVTSEDLQGNVTTHDGNFRTLTAASFNTRRPSGEGESARDHYFYRNPPTDADGLYHCPWEGDASCNHRPEKLKCNYDKFVDSHLKPYRCKVEACENVRFSSTACLLRHEREAHAMHGHGDKPFLCTYEGCERSLPGCGFPRQWNLRDHMRRVHNDNGTGTQSTTAPANQAPAAGSPPSTSANSASKGRKRKKDIPESSSHRKSSGTKTHNQGVVEVPSAPTQDSSHLSKTAGNPVDPLVDQWHSHRKALQRIAVDFPEQLEDPQVLQQIKEAQTHLASIGRISREAMAALKKADASGYRRSWK
ncbi:hypothetical protein VTK73DRAFT_9824 [Phialemonium thermophilum]|uniref:C2H2-type domain-containing protein n=1 Tax=Phialemonium thermophilum TaxID=223376 RepID=A0ABR3XII5_9PEZI